MSETNPQISVHELAEKLNSANPPKVVDVRNPDEFVHGHVPGAINVPLGTLGDRLADFGPDEPICLICQGGIRSEKARLMLMGNHSALLNVVGGTGEWINAGLPVERPI